MRISIVQAMSVSARVLNLPGIFFHHRVGCRCLTYPVWFSCAQEGGGLYVANSKTTLRNSQIHSNTAVSEGGGLYGAGGTITLGNGTAFFNLEMQDQSEEIQVRDNLLDESNSERLSKANNEEPPELKMENEQNK